MGKRMNGIEREMPARGDKQELHTRQIQSWIDQAMKNDMLCALFDVAQNKYKVLHAAPNDVLAADEQWITANTLNQLNHPLDRAFAQFIKQQALSIGNTLPAHEMRHLCLSFECRQQNKLGVYRRAIHQYSVVELDQNQRMAFLLLTIKPLSEMLDNDPPQAASLYNYQTRTLHKGVKSLLSNREIQVMRLVARGYETAEIAKEFFISPNTVSNHRRNVLAKINIKNPLLLVLYLRDMGLIA